MNICRLVKGNTTLFYKRIRRRCSSLNADLFNVNIIPYADCSFGVLLEIAEHYILEYNLYDSQKRRLLQTISQKRNKFRFLNKLFLFMAETNQTIMLADFKLITSTVMTNTVELKNLWDYGNLFKTTGSSSH